MQQLRHDHVGDLVVDGRAQEDDAVLEQAGIDVHRPLFAAAARALPAGLVLLAFRRQLPHGDWWWKSALLGLCNIGLFFPLIFLAAYHLPGGLAATPAAAQFAPAKTRVDATFAFPKDKTARIIVFRPDVSVGSVGIGGVTQANADWTATARTNLASAMRKHQGARGNELIFLPDQDGEKAQLVGDYQALFRAVAGAVITHKFYGAKLPTKKGRFDWTLGPGAAKLGAIADGDYALFVYSEDAYGDAGRKVAQLLMAGLFGAYVPAGIHVGYAGLVDLSNGNLVWFNVDPAAGGDPREAEGADKRVGQVLRNWPLREGEAPPPKKKK